MRREDRPAASKADLLLGTSHAAISRTPELSTPSPAPPVPPSASKEALTVTPVAASLGTAPIAHATGLAMPIDIAGIDWASIDIASINGAETRAVAALPAPAEHNIGAVPATLSPVPTNDPAINAGAITPPGKMAGGKTMPALQPISGAAPSLAVRISSPKKEPQQQVRQALAPNPPVRGERALLASGSQPIAAAGKLPAFDLPQIVAGTADHAITVPSAKVRTLAANPDKRVPPSPAFGKATDDPVPKAQQASKSFRGAMSGDLSADHKARRSIDLPRPEFTRQAKPDAPGSKEPGTVRLAAAMPEPSFGRSSATPPDSIPPTAAAASAERKEAAFVQPAAPTPAANARPGTLPGAQTAPPTADLANGPGPLPASPGAAVHFTYDDELILTIRGKNATGEDSLIAYGTTAGIYLPVGSLARYLDLAISVSDDGHYANGWFIDKSRTLSINLRQGQITLNGKVMPLAPGDASAFDGELYLRADKFAQILPIRIKTNLRDQSVTIETLEPFPFELRAKREAEREKLASRNGADKPRHWPRQKTPWLPVSVPLADVELRTLSDSALGTRLEGDLRLSGDLAYMTTQLFLGATTRDGLVSSRLEVGRRDPDARLLGPLHATEFQIGDVAMPTMTMGLKGTGGRGLAVTNAPLESASVFDAIDLRGPLPDGYEVELYRNGILVGSTRTPVNGQYEFLQLPVDYGINVFRFVFYGPQGQRSESVRTINVGDGRLSKGQLIYSVGMVQKDKNVFGTTGPNFTPSLDYGRWRGNIQLAYGINAALTATAGAAWFDTTLGRRKLVSAGLRTGIGRLAAKVDVGLEDRNATGVEVGIGGKLLGSAFTLTHAEYGGEFVDEVRSFTGEMLTRATVFNFNTTIGFGKGAAGGMIPLSARLQRLQYRNGQIQTTASLRASTRLSTLMVSNSLDYSNTIAPLGANFSQLGGSFDLSTLAGSRRLIRASASYEIVPSPRIASTGLEMDYQFDDRTRVHGGISYAFREKDTQVTTSLVHKIGPVSLAFDGTYGFGLGNYAVGLRLGFSFGRNPLTRRMFVGAPGLASAGAVAVRAYRDQNGNNRFDPGERAIPKVAFSSSNRTVEADDSGVALLTGLGSGTRASVQADPSTFPDIMDLPESRGFEVIPRPGRIHVSDYAIEATSDIEGTAFFTSKSSSRGVSGLRLDLLGADGKVVKSARTEADGYFLFEQLPPGTYRIRIDPDQARSLNITINPPSSVKVDAKSSTLEAKLFVERTK